MDGGLKRYTYNLWNLPQSLPHLLVVLTHHPTATLYMVEKTPPPHKKRKQKRKEVIKKSTRKLFILPNSTWDRTKTLTIIIPIDDDIVLNSFLDCLLCIYNIIRSETKSLIRVLKSLASPSHRLLLLWTLRNKGKGHLEIPEGQIINSKNTTLPWTPCLQFVHIHPDLKLKNKNKMGRSEEKLESN